MAELPPILSSSPPPLDHGFMVLDDEEEEAPNSFQFGKLDFDDESNSPQPNKQSKSIVHKRSPPRQNQHHTESLTPQKIHENGSRDPLTLPNLNHVPNTSASIRELGNASDEQRNKENDDVLRDTEVDFLEGRKEANFSDSGISGSTHCSVSTSSVASTTAHAESLGESKDGWDVDSWVLPQEFTANYIALHSPVTEEGYLRSNKPGSFNAEKQSALIAKDNSGTGTVITSESFVASGIPLEQASFNTALDTSAIESAEKQEDDEWAEFSEFTSLEPTENFRLEEERAEDDDDFEEFQTAPSYIMETASEKTLTPVTSFEDDLQETFVLSSWSEDTGPTITLDIDAKTCDSPSEAARIWKLLKNLDDSNALKFQWTSSAVREKLLQSLNLNVLSHFAMQKKDAVSLHKATKNVDILLPVRVDHSKDGLDMDLPQPHGSLLGNSDRSSVASSADSTLLRIPQSDAENSQGDFSKSSANAVHVAVNIPLKSSSDSLKLEHQNHDFPKPVGKTINGGVTQSLKSSEDEVQEILNRFRNLDFMQSAKIVVPKHGPKLRKF